MSHRFRFKQLIPFVVLAGSLAVGALLVRPVEDFVRARMENLREVLLDSLRREYGLVLTYEHLDYSLLLGARVRGARLAWVDGEEFVTCQSLSVDYDFFSLLGGNLGRAIKGLNLDTARLELDVDKRSGFLEKIGLLDPAAAGRSLVLADVNDLFMGLYRSLPKDVAFRVNQLELGIRSRDVQVRTAIDQARLEAAEQELQVQLSSGFRLDLPSLVLPAGFGLSGAASLESRLTVGARFYPLQRELRLTCQTAALQTPWFDIRPQGFNLDITDAGINLVKLPDAQALDLSVDYDQAKTELSLHLAAADWQLLSLLSPKVDLPELVRHAAGTVLEAGADLTWNLGRQTLDYRGKVAASGWIPGLGQGEVYLDAAGDLAALRVNNATLASADLQLACRGSLEFRDLAARAHLAVASPTLLPGYPLQVQGDVAGSWSTGYRLPQVELGLGTYRARLRELRLGLGGPVIEASGRAFQLDAAGQEAGSITADLAYSQAEQAFERLDLGLDSWRLVEGDSLYGLLAGLVLPLLPESVAAYLPRELLASGTVSLPANAVLDEGFDPLGLVVRGLDIRVASPLYRAGFILDMDNYQLRLRNGSVHAGDQVVGLRVQADLSQPDKISGTGALWTASIPETGFSLSWARQGMVDLQTSNGLYLNARLDDLGASGFVRLERFPLGILGVPQLDGLVVSTSGNYRLASVNEWQAELELVDFGFMKLNPLVPDRKIRLWAEKISLGPEGLKARKVSLQDTVSLVSGPLSASWAEFPPRDLQLELNLVRSKGLPQTPLAGSLVPEAYAARLRLRPDGGLEGNLVVKSSPLNRFFAEGLNGWLNGEVGLGGSLADPVIQGRFDVAQGTFNKDALTVDGRFRYDAAGLGISALHLGLGDNQLEAETLACNLAGASLAGRGVFRNKAWAAEAALPWSLAADWDASSFWQKFNGSLEIRNLPAWLAPSGLWAFSAKATGDRIVFGEEQSRSIQGTVFNDFSYELLLEAPFPIRTTASGFFRGTRMEANLMKVSLDASISRLFPFAKDFWMSEGLITGDVRIAGDTNDPGFYGNLKGENLVAHVAYLPEPVRAKKALATCSDHSFKLLPLQARTGEARAQVTMDLELSRLNVQSVRLAVATEDETGVRLDTSFPGIKVAGTARGKMEFAFLPNRMELYGDLVVQEADLALGQWGEEKKPPAGTAPPVVDDYGMVVDLDITTARRVVFYWPSRELALLTAYIDPAQKVHFSWNKNRETYSLKGQVKSRGGSITYLKRDFILRETFIDFNESQSGFDPFISFKADLRTFIEDQSYRLTWLADHERLSQLFQSNARMEAVPALSQGQIASLLSGDTLGENDTTSWENLLTTAADATSQLALKNVLDPLRVLIGADVMMIRLGFIKGLTSDFLNLLSPEGTQIDSLEKYLDGTSFLVGKYLGDDLYLEGGVQVVDSGGIFGTKDLDMSVEVNMEWATPLFNLVWTFRPRDAESLFLPDNTFSFTFDLIR